MADSSTISEMIALISAGGWNVASGVLLQKFGVSKGEPVSFADGDDGEILWDCGNKTIRLRNDRVRIKVVRDPNPREIRVCGPIKVWEQRKKSDGGDFHEVEQEGGRVLTLVNPEAQRVHDEMMEVRRKERAEKQAQDDAIKEVAGNAKMIRAQEELRVQMIALGAKILAKIGAATVSSLDVSYRGLSLTFQQRIHSGSDRRRR